MASDILDCTHVEMCKIFIDSGTLTSNKSNSTVVALHIIAINGHTEACPHILGCGANTDNKDNYNIGGKR